VIESDGYVLDDGSNVLVRRLSNYADHEGRFRYGYAILDAGHELLAVGTDIRTGVGGNDGPCTMLATLCGFLQAFAEAQGRPGSENADLFPPDLAEWASAHSDELALVELRLREHLRTALPGRPS
jgi:hypothetical protein